MDEDTLAQLTALAAKCADASVWPLSDDALVDCLDTIHQITQTLTAAQSHLIREIDGRGLPVAGHASSMGVWLREHLRVSMHAAKRMVELARAVDERPALDAALVAGVVNAEQAAVVAAAIRDLPVEPGLVDRAEAVLIGQAQQFEPAILRKAGERVLAHVAPELADARDAAVLRRQEGPGVAEPRVSADPVG
ncbi:hypothetical protein GCM10022251_25240 [Phytohabitans flavus]|uniref:DUF222 domain-containing protein n=1 Tax=Phytohabitans flavus TaxID=1076124 RepID=A0A6F8XRA0_9ACTN|nr:hypothetical protein Pflav_026810 [Phytohabitans flavus]